MQFFEVFLQHSELVLQVLLIFPRRYCILSQVLILFSQVKVSLLKFINFASVAFHFGLQITDQGFLVSFVFSELELYSVVLCLVALTRLFCLAKPGFEQLFLELELVVLLLGGSETYLCNFFGHLLYTFLVFAHFDGVLLIQSLIVSVSLFYLFLRLTQFFFYFITISLKYCSLVCFYF